MLAELGDPLTFTDARGIVAFAGLNPKLQESGQHKGTARISRAGSARLRAGLYMSAIVTMTPLSRHFRSASENGARPGSKSSAPLCVNCCISFMACSNPASRSIRHWLLQADTQDGIHREITARRRGRAPLPSRLPGRAIRTAGTPVQS
ncbi:transposase [Halomonas sp. IOP_31]|uniref:transposase n=1 Tax=Halomonas sp. IOP_31 TaxID=2876584 RepID=UPI003FA52F5F|nr:IS110 family transposase [Halomonas sp. IOP_31]